VVMRMKLEDWKPWLCRATWFDPTRRLTERERILCAVLDSVITHDNAADVRGDRPNCSEVQHAMDVINVFAGSEIWKPRT
jgi:hypothetical protein